MEASPSYKFLLEDIDLMQKREAETSVTLQEDKLKEEREKNRAKSKQREAAIKAIREGAPLELTAATGGSAEEFDFILDESIAVMADYIPLAK